VVYCCIFTVTGGKHELVPQNVYAEAEKFAKVGRSFLIYLIVPCLKLFEVRDIPIIFTFATVSFYKTL
jgi:hypothetical protein